MMNWKSYVIGVLLLGGTILVLTMHGELSAQDIRPPSKERDIHELVELIREEQLLRELELDEKRVEPLLHNLRAGHQLKNSYLLQQYLFENELAALVNYSTPNQEKISSVLQKLETAKLQYYQSLVKNEQERKELLSPEEQARYLLFQKQFNQQLKDLIAKVRQHATPEDPSSNHLLRSQPQESVIRKPR